MIDLTQMGRETTYTKSGPSGRDDQTGRRQSTEPFKGHPEQSQIRLRLQYNGWIAECCPILEYSTDGASRVLWEVWLLVVSCCNVTNTFNYSRVASRVDQREHPSALPVPLPPPIATAVHLPPRRRGEGGRNHSQRLFQPTSS